ncbi:MAG: phosphoribosylamine--glycine ligase [Dermatophilaceae bacterium]
MKVLVIGSGAREHALVRALDADCAVDEVLAAPGNPGIADLAHCEPLADVTDAAAVLDLATRHTVDLVVIGPEAPLVAGVADVLRGEGYAVFGPSAEAARLEGSKSFAKEVMAAAGVPTALAHVCTTEAEVAAAVDGFGTPHVVKDDGLAAGKGVIVTDDREAALAHARACLAKEGGRVVVEEYLDGPEVSVFCVTDGETVLALAPAQDYKRVGDGDCGPNTGGMGAYSPLPWAPAGLADDVVARIAQPTVDEMHRRGMPFVGALYVGLALTTRGMRVVEFNARFGDPDGQVSLARLVTPLGGLLMAAATGRLDEYTSLRQRRDSAVVVVLAAQGYPAAPRTGDPLLGLEPAARVDGAYLLHAGTRRTDSGALVSAGGRVLDVVALGADLATARDTAYRAVKHLGLAGSHYRSDIALRAVRGDIRLGEESR